MKVRRICQDFLNYEMSTQLFSAGPARLSAGHSLRCVIDQATSGTLLKISLCSAEELLPCGSFLELLPDHRAQGPRMRT